MKHKSQNKKRKHGIRVGAGQIAVTGDMKKNFFAMKKLVDIASRKRVKAVLFPECALTGYPPLIKKPLSLIKKENPEKWIKEIQKLAKENGIYIIFGSVRFAKNNAHNSAYAINPKGEIIAIYDKVQLVGGINADTKYFKPGKRFPVFRIERIPCAIQICLDMRYPENYRYLKSKGVKIVFQPFFVTGKKEISWKIPVLEGSLRCRSAENGFFMVASNNCGKTQLMISRIVDRNGVSLAHSRIHKQELIYANLDMTQKHGHFYESRRRDILNVVPTGKLRKKDYR